MFFFLSKTLSYVTMPLVIICFIFLLSVVVKNKIRKVQWIRIGTILLFFFTNDFIANEVTLWWEVPPTPFVEIKKTFTYGILLTGVGKSDIEPTDRVYFSRGADRVTHTLQLYRLGLIRKILISGGNGSIKEVRKQEADEMAEVLELMGVPKADILIENKSRNTHESAIEVGKILSGTVRPEECIVVTSSFHIRRTKACFQKQNLDVELFSTDFISHKRKFTPDSLIIPSVGALNNWHILFREWTGMVAYKLVGYI